MQYITKLFKALSDATRLRILYLLISSKTELCICELITALNIPQYNISKHMKELKNAGLVKERKDGRFVFYSFVECCDGFTEKILKTLGAAETKELALDLKALKARLAKRKCAPLKECKC